jgi:uncharacterized protein
MHDEALPPYTHTPGVTPHPISDSRGHSFGHEATGCEAFEPGNWRDCPPYVRGLMLFVRGYYWEAHEAWEAAWNSVGRAGAAGDFLKGLIKLAAAGVKAREGNRDGVRRHGRRAVELLRGVAGVAMGRDDFAGLSLEKLIRAAERIAGDETTIVRRPDGVPVVFWRDVLAE